MPWRFDAGQTPHLAEKAPRGQRKTAQLYKALP